MAPQPWHCSNQRCSQVTQNLQGMNMGYGWGKNYILYAARTVGAGMKLHVSRILQRNVHELGYNSQTFKRA